MEAQKRRSPPEGPDAAPAAGATPGSEESVPWAVYEEALRKAEERDLYRNELLRERADFSNYQKRIVRDRPQMEVMAVRRIVLDLLPVIDNFERALAHEGSSEEYRKGIEMVKEMLVAALAKHGIEAIDPLGKVFDPNLHEAVAHEESKTFPPDTVSEVVLKGYLQNGTVIRAAKVKVARAPLDVATPPAGPPG